MLAFARQLIRIPSTNFHGTVKLARYVAAALESLGFEIDYQQARFCGVLQLNLLARIGPKGGRALLLNTHLDTVATDPKKWTKTRGDPFIPTLHKGRLYGLGSADTKLALACQWQALKNLKHINLQRPLLITGTYGEEMGLVGVQQLITHPWIRAADVLNSEPTELRPVHGNYGFRVYRVVGKEEKFEWRPGTKYKISFAGKATHSAYARHGLNAIDLALRWLKTQCGFFHVLSARGGLAPNIVAPSCTLEILSTSAKLDRLKEFGGKILSQVSVKRQKIWPNFSKFLFELADFALCPSGDLESSNLGTLCLAKDRIEIVMDHRFAAGKNPNTVFQSWKKYLKNYSIFIEKDNPSCPTKDSSLFLKEVQSILRVMRQDIRPMVKRGCTEAGYFSQAGCDVVTFGPGAVYNNAHQPNESVSVLELERALIFYQEMIKRCSSSVV